jgi:hypothetical protein
MITQHELERRLQSDARDLDRDFPGADRLELRIMARVAATPREQRRRAPTLKQELALAGLFVVVVALLAIGIGRLRAMSPYLPAAPTPTVASTPMPVPPGSTPSRWFDGDLAAAQLTPAASVVTTLNLVSTSNGRTVNLVGAYADTTRTVLVLRTIPVTGAAQVQVSDDQGPLTSAYFGAPGVWGDQVVGFQQGPHASADGVAHLRVTVSGFVQNPPSAKVSPGNWTFALALKVQPAMALPMQPRPTSVGTWKVNVEAFELTPSGIHFRAVLTGPATTDINDSTVAMLDETGTPIKPQTIDPASIAPHQTRLDETWARPAGSATYRLLVTGGGGQYTTSVDIPGPPAVVQKGFPLSPTDYPQATMSLNLHGAITQHIGAGRPQSCGVATGPSGTLFGFATYFQSNILWYYVSFDMDPAVKPYRGPGTYPVTVVLYPVLGGPTFRGTGQLTVTSDRQPDSGRVTATLGWTEDPTQSISVSGAWTCMPGGQLGPG